MGSVIASLSTNRSSHGANGAYRLEGSKKGRRKGKHRNVTHQRPEQPNPLPEQRFRPKRGRPGRPRRPAPAGPRAASSPARERTERLAQSASPSSASSPDWRGYPTLRTGLKALSGVPV